MEFVTLLEMCSRFNLNTEETVQRVMLVYNHILVGEQKLTKEQIQLVCDVNDIDVEVISAEIPQPPIEEDEPKAKKYNFSPSNILASVLTSGFSELHFVTKSMADGMLKLSDLVPVLEAKLVSKITKEEQDDIIEDRHNKTAESQEAIINGFKSIGNTMSKAHNHVMEVIHETVVTS